MAVILPTFNIDMQVSTGNTSPATGATWVLTANCQRYIYSRRDPDNGLAAYWGRVISQFRIDPVAWYGVFTLANIFSWNLGFIECPVGSGRYYRVTDWDVNHEGFSNEYPVVWAFRCNDVGYPQYAATANSAFWTPTPPQQYGPVP